MIQKLKILAVLICFLQINLIGQKYTSTSSKAIKHFDQGHVYYQQTDYNSATNSFLKAIQADPEFIEAYIMLAETYYITRNNAKAIDYYKIAINKKPGFHQGSYLQLANTLYSSQRYEEAKEYYQQFIAFNPVNKVALEIAQKKYNNCFVAAELMKNPVPFNPINLGDSINSEYDEYWPSLTADEELMTITVNVPINKADPVLKGNRQEDFYISKKSNGNWAKVVDAGFPLNTQDNEGAQTLTADGKTMIFTACNRPDGKGRCDLYITRKNGDVWLRPKSMDAPINTRYSEKQPSLSSDGRTLFFASDRPGTFGQLDLWYSYLRWDNTWADPVNLGTAINTTGNDMAPYIHPDGQTLYFTSDEHAGMGGLDIFITKKDTANVWAKPLNIGYPINTSADERGIIVNTRGDKAYLSSNRSDSRGGMDIYEFEIPLQIRPKATSFMKGRVFDAETKKPLSAQFELIDINTQKKFIESYSQPENGEFIITIPSNIDYALNVSRKGYLFYSEHLHITEMNSATKPLLVEIGLQPIKPGKTIILNNIFFETNAFELKQESIVELNKLLELLKLNPLVKIEIGGHTDNVGSDDYNQKLSENRAKSVVEYLINQKINPARLVHKGYGKTKPIAGNETEAGRATNRRTELTIIE